jgi:putative spermidine/putrescine transport system permease protein
MNSRSGRLGAWRTALLVVLALYFFVPLLAMARFALQRIPMVRLSWNNVFEGWSLADLGKALTDERTVQTAQRSLLLAGATIVLTLVFLVPVATFVEVQAPRLRSLVMVLTLTPWVMPPIALVVGVAGTFRTVFPSFLSSPWSLVPFYTLWALPFSYRALDGGLRAMGIRTLFEASRSMGASWTTFFLRVVLPNLVSSIIVVAALTGSLVLGEFAFASLLLKQTLPTHLVVLQGGEPRAGLALALLVMVLTTLIIGLAASLLRRRGLSFNAAGI